ncbi:MAG: hypothetical protein E7018_05970 [Alphaproteobacteria bacterium]|nr:hypothetical protein [Alphaproteobacteria bacterium]
MSTIFDIKKIGKAVIILLAAMFVLVGCSDEHKDNPATKAIASKDAATQAVEADPALGEQCWQGRVLNLLYTVIGTTVMKQYDKLSSGSMSLMMIGFAIWVALRLLKFVSSVTESSPAEIWNEIIRKAFICVLCGSLAYSSGSLLYVVNYFLMPIYGAFLEFGSQIMSLSETQISSIKVFNEEIVFKMQGLGCAIGEDTNASIEGGFPPAYQTTMNCMICTLVDKLRIGRNMAFVAMSMDGVLPWVTGLLVLLIFWVVGFGFVFYLVDSVFRFGMIILMLPIFIMAYAFGPTRKWTGIGFSNIMHSAAFMMAFSIIIATSLLAIMTLIADPETGMLFDPDDSETHFRQISIVTLCLLLMGFLVFGSLGVAQQLTSAIIGGHVDSKFQQNLKAVGQTILGIVTSGFGWMVAKSGFYDNTKIGRALKGAGDLRNRMNRLAGRPVGK